MNLQSYAAFILDLDGTLIDSGKYHARAFADAVFEQSGYRLAPEEHNEFFASHTDDFSLVLNARHGLSLDPLRLLDLKRIRMREIFEVELFDGVQEFLDRWRGRKPLALATNSPQVFVMPALRRLDLVEYFDCITTGDEVKHRKPNPEIIEKTIQKLGVDPLETLVFEDQLMGVYAARAAGAEVVAVDNGQPVEFPNDVVVTTWRKLLEHSERD